jgi:serine/threonine-protein kinase
MDSAHVLLSTRSGAAYQLGKALPVAGLVYHEALDEVGRVRWIKEVSANDAAAIAGLRNEAILLSKLKHPGIVQLHDRGRNRACFFLVLDAPPGLPLNTLIAQGPLSIDLIYSLAVQIAELLVYLHSQGVLCRVLLPNAFFVDQRGHTVYADLSHAWDEVSPLRRDNLLAFASYLSPEQVGGADADRRGDIYSFGALLFEAISGRPPFQSSNRGDVALQQVLVPAPDVRSLAPETPDDLAALITRCLEKTPERRFSDATALLSALYRLNLAEAHMQVK